MNRRARRAEAARSKRSQSASSVDAVARCLADGYIIRTRATDNRYKRSVGTFNSAAAALTPASIARQIGEIAYGRRVKAAVEKFVKENQREGYMAKPNLEELLQRGGAHRLVPVTTDGVTRFYIHPDGVDGDTLDFEVHGNELTQLNAEQPAFGQEPDPKPASESDVPAGTEPASASAAADASSSAASEDPLPPTSDAGGNEGDPKPDASATTQETAAPASEDAANAPSAEAAISAASVSADPKTADGSASAAPEEPSSQPAETSGTEPAAPAAGS